MGLDQASRTIWQTVCILVSLMFEQWLIDLAFHVFDPGALIKLMYRAVDLEIYQKSHAYFGLAYQESSLEKYATRLKEEIPIIFSISGRLIHQCNARSSS